MNKKKLENAFDGIIKRLQKTEAFVLKELPLVAQELHAETRMELMFPAIVSAAIFLLSGLATAGLLYMAITDARQYGPSDWYPGVLFVGTANLVSLVILISSVRDLLLFRAAPKIWIVRKLRKIV